MRADNEWVCVCVFAVITQPGSAYCAPRCDKIHMYIQSYVSVYCAYITGVFWDT